MHIGSSYSKDFRGIEFFPREEVLNVQRPHAIILVMPLLLVSIFAFLTIGFTTFLFYFRYIQEASYIILLLPLTAAMLSFLLGVATYVFIQWFYQFYIITNKRLIHVHYFRIGGFHLDEVFYEHTKPLEIDRHPQNFLLDFLGIEDVYVYFKSLERPEPFIFKTPPDSNTIEELLEHHLLIEKNGR